MKNLSLAILMLGAASLTVSAQEAAIKEAKAFKLGQNYVEFVEKIQPMLADPATAGSAEVMQLVGKKGFENYDNYLKLYSIGTDVDQKDMGMSLLRGYEFYNKALPLDTVVDAKGKVKTKFSKNIVKDIASHHNDFNTAAAMLWGAKEYPAAYEAWGIYLDMPTDARLGKDAPKALADTIASTVSFNRGLAAWQSNNYENAMSSFDNAIALNYDDPMIYEYAAEVARLAGNTDRQLAYAQAGYDATKDAKYLMVLINNYIDKEDYATATELLNTAINTADTPREKAYLYVLSGIIAERTDPVAAKGGNNVLDNYKKAVDLDNTYGGAYYNYGRMLLIQANERDENETGKMTQAQYNQFKEKELFPMMREAAEYIEKGYALDESLTPAISLLQQIYYMLGDNENYERVKNL